MKYQIYCNIPSLQLSVPINFSSELLKLRVIKEVSETISTIRLPAYSFDKSSFFHLCNEVNIEGDINGNILTVKFDCQLFGESYSLDISGFHWDFWKVVIASFSKELMKQKGMVSHAACVKINGKVILLPGHSGAGKSSVSYACLERDIPVFASELCYIKNGKIIAGNLHASIDDEALKRFGIKKPENTEVKANRVLSEITELEVPEEIDLIIFPNVRLGGIYAREISGRRARMILYENIFGQLPSGQLINHVKIPISPLPSAEELEAISEQLIQLTSDKSYIIEGHPAKVVDWLQKNI